jgi:hypothetical protein
MTKLWLAAVILIAPLAAYAQSPELRRIRGS